MPEGADIEPEDATLVTLARSARVRTNATEAVAVRDTTGRTFTAVSVTLPSLALTACQAVAAAVVVSAGGALETAVILSEAPEVDDADLAVLSDLGAVVVVLVRPDGTVAARSRLA